MNAPLLSAPRVEPFFFDADPGTRFSLYHAPSPHLPGRGAILYVHPFAEELNHSRRMAALQARRFAALGYAVLQIDLFGCGDSCGDFHAARWDGWKGDLATALAWLTERCAGPLNLWGVRLGGLLALDFAAGHPVDGLILWQPWLNGRSCINHFLRQHGAAAQGHAGSGALRSRLAAQGSLEIGGYELGMPLARAIDACDATAMVLPPCTIHWFATGPGDAARLAPTADRLAARWAPHGATLHFHALSGLPFWQTGEPCAALLDATTAALAAPAS